MKQMKFRAAAVAVLVAFFPLSGGFAAEEVTPPSTPEEQYETGRKLHRGDGVTADPDKAAHWIRLAAEAGHPEAQGYYGYLLSKGEGVAKDTDEAIRWMRRAAEHEVVSAQLNLGLILFQQTGETARTEALGWVEKAADGGSAEAQAKLAEFYHFGLHGLKKDPEKALAWARKAAEGGNVWSQNLYATMLEWGIGVKIDRTAALDWYRKSAEKGNAKAQASLGRLLASGLVGKRDVVEAYYWLWQSMTQGEPNGTNLIKELIPGMTKEERHAALRRVGIEPEEIPGTSTAVR